jgi:uncharacterized protein (DUF2236 family)
VRPLSGVEQDRAYAEGLEAGRLYGAMNLPSSRAPVMPPLLRPAQRMMVRAAVEIVPGWAKTLLGLEGKGQRPFEAALLRRAGALSDRIVIANGPAAQASKRLRLPTDYVYR